MPLLRRLAPALSLALILAAPASAGEIGAANKTTAEYFKDCRNNAACRHGIMDELYDYDEAEQCGTEDETEQTIVEKTLRWIEAHPGLAKEDAWETTDKAFKALWPCN